MHKWLFVVLAVLPITACSDKKSQSPEADQKQIEQEHQKAMEEQKKLTSGEGNSMLRDEPQANKTTQQQQKPAKPNPQQKAAKPSPNSAQH
jgi:hypothetical protein